MIEKSIAIIGVSDDPNKYGYKIFKDLLEAGVLATGINPKKSLILEHKIYPDLKSLREPPQLVITVVPPKITEKVIEECHELGIKEVWMQPGSESNTAIEKAQKYGIHVTHHACIMTQNGIW